MEPLFSIGNIITNGYYIEIITDIDFNNNRYEVKEINGHSYGSLTFKTVHKHYKKYLKDDK